MNNEDTTDNDSISQDLKFEDAVERLSHIVNEMEDSEVDLDKMIRNYQKGLSLLKFCQKRLKKLNSKLQKYRKRILLKTSLLLLIIPWNTQYYLESKVLRT